MGCIEVLERVIRSMPRVCGGKKYSSGEIYDAVKAAGVDPEAVMDILDRGSRYSGRTAEMCRILGVSGTAPYVWKRNKYIPKRHRAKIVGIAADNGLTISEDELA